MPVRDRNVIITGAASGIGAALARRFAAEGAAGLLLADLDADGLARVADELAGAPATVVARRVDLADADEITAMVAAAEAQLGPIDLCCSNAGIGTGEGLKASAESWERSWAVNVLAHVHAARAVLPAMLERGGGRLLHTCSAAGLLSMPGDAPYSVTKHAAVAFAEWLSVTYGARGIGVHALCPQGVATPLLTEGLEQGAVSARIVAGAGEILTPEQVAEVTLEALADGRFLVLPHPEVVEHLRRKASDPDRWLASMQRIVATAEAG